MNCKLCEAVVSGTGNSAAFVVCATCSGDLARQPATEIANALYMAFVAAIRCRCGEQAHDGPGYAMRLKFHGEPTCRTCGDAKRATRVHDAYVRRTAK